MTFIQRYELTENVETGVVAITPVPENMEGTYVLFTDWEAAQQRIAELEDKEFRSSEIKKIMRERFEAAEAELARRDAAAG